VRQAQTQVSIQDLIHVPEGAPVLHLFGMCLCVQSFHFADPELRRSGQDCAHVHKCVPMLRLLKMCLQIQSFLFADPEFWQA